MDESQSSTLKFHMETKQAAYRQLVRGAATLLKTDSLFWTERLLLKVMGRLAEQRLTQLGEVVEHD